MESKEPITAEEFEELPTTQEYINKRFREEFKRDYYEVIHHEHNFNHDFIEEFTYKAMHEYAVLFAKHHRERMIRDIANSVEEAFPDEGLYQIVENAYDESKIV